MHGCLRRFVAVGLHLLLAYLRRWAAPVLLFFCRRWAAPFWVFRSLSPLGCTCFVFFLSPLGCTCCWLICAVGLHLFSFFFRRWAAPFGVFRSLSRWAAPALPLKSRYGTPAFPAGLSGTGNFPNSIQSKNSPNI